MSGKHSPFESPKIDQLDLELQKVESIFKHFETYGSKNSSKDTFK